MRLAAFIVAAVLALGAAVFGTLLVTGGIALPWQHREPARRPVPAGSVMVPVGVRPMRAYDRVTRDDLLAVGPGGSLQPRTFPESPAAMSADDPPLAEPRLILNRVLRYDKQPNYVFHESDFFPPGTTPGEAAGVPPGKVAITFEAAQVSGVRDLKPGDHVDVGGTLLVDLSKTKFGDAAVGGVPLGASKAAPYRQLAYDAVVVSGLRVRQVPYMTTAGLNSAAQVRTKPVEEVTIAVDPSEVPAVQQALGTGSAVACMLHSGQPATRPNANRATADEQPQYTTVDEVVGTKHTVKVLPKPSANGGQP